MVYYCVINHQLHNQNSKLDKFVRNYTKSCWIYNPGWSVGLFVQSYYSLRATSGSDAASPRAC